MSSFIWHILLACDLQTFTHSQAVQVGTQLLETIPRLWSLRVTYAIHFYLAISLLILHNDFPDHGHLDGKMDQFWFREDKPGVVFLMNTESVEEARSMIDTLPLAAEGYLVFEYIPVGPLQPLGLLIQPH